MFFLFIQGGVVGSMDGTCRFYNIIGIPICTNYKFVLHSCHTRVVLCLTE